MPTRTLDAASLILENGAVFEGYVPSWQSDVYYGEAVFNTGMTGYPESLTDPSYAGQLLTFTYPLIGNYGVPENKHWESNKIHAAGAIINENCVNWSHHQGIQSFAEWLRDQNIPLILGIDTRALTKYLRSAGTMTAAIAKKNTNSLRFPKLASRHWVSEVSLAHPKSYGNAGKKIIAVDCGMKENIVRCLSQFPISIKRVPHDYDYTQEDYDGIFLSNGPGDPTTCVKTISILQKAMTGNKPIFGICLGTQLMALASGASTYKLPFGHRGQNQPCQEIATRRCFITSQNHGYAIKEESLSSEWSVTFKNLNDDSVEGIAHKTKPFFSIQFHPEATPGPTDTVWLFDKFIKAL